MSFNIFHSLSEVKDCVSADVFSSILKLLGKFECDCRNIMQKPDNARMSVDQLIHDSRIELAALISAKQTEVKATLSDIMVNFTFLLLTHAELYELRKGHEEDIPSPYDFARKYGY